MTGWPDVVPARPARGSRGAVVAPHHLATAAGLGVLAAGGSAVDAAIATNAVLGVVMPNGCGLGGDAFWLVWDEAAGEQVALNGSGRAPAASAAAALRDRGLSRIPLRGPLSITVPGAVRSWGDAHRRWGRLTRDEVLAPAIEQAWAGFPAWGGFVRAVEATAAEVGAEAWARGFHAVYRPHGRAWRPGEPVRLPALATTLDALAREGFDTFYEGETGDAMAGALIDAGAPFAAEDLLAHASTWDDPIATTYRGVRVTTHPPNSSGVVALQILGILEAFAPPEAGAYGPRGWTDPAWVHLQLEAAKLAFTDRDSHLADPEARDIPVTRLLDRAYAAELAGRIDPLRADPAPPPARLLVGGTIYLATVDADGNAVSLIQSNAAGFGSGVVDPATGVHFQDRGASFSLEPGHPNELVGGRRTAHTLLPAMLFRAGEDRPWIVAGSMGGDIQPQVHAQLVSALVDGRADIAAAVAAPRVAVMPAGHLAPPVAVFVEPGGPSGLAASLQQLGHPVTELDREAVLGHEHAIELIDGGPAAGGTLAATTDPRSEGLPAMR